MSLNWDATKCDPAVLETTEWPTTEALIFATMTLGMRGITAENASEFAQRMYAWQQAFGPAMSQVGEDGKLKGYEITLADVKRRIGLRTNVSPESAAKFKNRLARLILDEAAAKVRLAEKQSTDQ